MFKTTKMVYEHPEFAVFDDLDLCVLCQSTTEGYDSVDNESFENGWI